LDLQCPSITIASLVNDSTELLHPMLLLLYNIGNINKTINIIQNNNEKLEY